MFSRLLRFNDVLRVSVSFECEKKKYLLFSQYLFFSYSKQVRQEVLLSLLGSMGNVVVIFIVTFTGLEFFSLVVFDIGTFVF